MRQPSDKVFAQLALWEDPVPRDGPAQMACDEVLLGLVGRPVMRIFRWRRPWVSAGYFAAMDLAEVAAAGLPVCRRWTGGGIVVHAGDFTFSLCVPRGEALAAIRPAESYHHIHLALAAALREAGVQTDLSAYSAKASPECFAAAVEHDLLSGGAKIAGGAQRRTRRGLLHQGSVQVGEPLPGDFALILARSLSHTVQTWTPPDDFEACVGKLAGEKYASAVFLRGPSRTLSPSEPINFTPAAAC